MGKGKVIKGEKGKKLKMMGHLLDECRIKKEIKEARQRISSKEVKYRK